MASDTPTTAALAEGDTPRDVTGQPSPEVLESISIEYRMGCPNCRALNPVPGLVDSLNCFGCDQLISLRWNDHLPDERRYFLLLAGDREDLCRGHLVEVGDRAGLAEDQYSLTLKREPVHCRCGHSLHIGLSELQSGAVMCPECNEPIQVQIPSGDARQLFGRLAKVQYVVGAQPTNSRDNRDIRDHGAVTLRCSNCGAPLTTSRGAHSARCEFCKASEIISPRLLSDAERWPPKVTFYLLVPSLDREALLAARYGTREQAMDAARRPRTPVEVLRFLAHSPEQAVRLALIENPSTPESVLVDLAKSDPETAGEWLFRRFQNKPRSEAIEAALAPVREKYAQKAAATAKQEADWKRFEKKKHRRGFLFTLAVLAGLGLAFYVCFYVFSWL